jgi:hypothetical protein
VGRKSRLKRQRGNQTPAVGGAPVAPAVAPEDDARPESRSYGPTRERGAKPVGARVARVAVDDETWAAFRELCGSTPASIRLGQLVAAEVERARAPARETDVVAAVKAIRDHADELEAFVRGMLRGQ